MVVEVDGSLVSTTSDMTTAAEDEEDQGGVGIIISDRGSGGWFGCQAANFFLEPPQIWWFRPSSRLINA